MLERKILRRIYGPTQEGGCWRSRWNNELYSLYNEPNIVEDIKIRRLEWAVHVIRMEEERIPKKVLNGNFHTTRTVRRPRTRWSGCGSEGCNATAGDKRMEEKSCE
jgi:hypothetical protein